MAGPKVSIDDLALAAEWLRINNGDGGESEACDRVATWIAAEIEARKLQAIAREATKQVGHRITPTMVAAKLRDIAPTVAAPDKAGQQ